MTAGQFLTSKNTCFQLHLTKSGFVGIVRSIFTNVVWSVNTGGKFPRRLELQPGGNLVVTGETQTDVLWSTNTSGFANTTLTLTDNGTLAITTPDGTTLWTTNSTVLPCISEQT